jgi:hypothetical protein
MRQAASDDQAAVGEDHQVDPVRGIELGEQVVDVDLGGTGR